MAYRIHVTAIRDCSQSEIRDTFGQILGPNFAEVPVQEHAGWISFRTSVWGVSSSDLIKGLAELGRPALQFTTEDASRWYVTFCLPGREPETLVHDFGDHHGPVDEQEWHDADEDEEPVDPELAFLEEEPVESQQPKSPFDRFAEQYSELGAPLPSRLLKEARGLSFDDAIRRFRKWQLDRMINFLESVRVTCDADAVRQVLSWERLTDNEMESDIGNLPRLLSIIGLGGEWDRYLDEAENPPPAPSEEEIQPVADSPSWIDSAERLTQGIHAVDVEGGPAHLPMEQFHLVRFFPEACQVQNDIAALVTVELPDSFDEHRLDRSIPKSVACARAEFTRLPKGFKIGFENHLLVERRHIAKQLGPDIAATFKSPPEDTILECAFAAKNEPATRQVYRGTVTGGVWRIDAAYPVMPASILSEALKLVTDAPKTRHIVRDANEAEAVMAAVAKDSYLHSMDVKRHGLEISCEYDVEFLAKIIFRLRFRDYWNVRPAEQNADAEYQERIEMERKMRKSVVAMARKTMAARRGEPIHRGKASLYWRSDLDHFSDLESDIRERFENGMKALDFTILGDLTTKRFRDYVLRCYLSADRLTYACLTASTYGYLAWDFVSNLSNGSRLTTTTSPMVTSRPRVKLYYRDYPGLGPEDLYQQHLRLIERFRVHKHATPIPLDPSLAGLAKVFDDSIVRTDEDENTMDEED